MRINKKSIIFFLLLAGFFICFSSCASTAGAGKNQQLYVWLTNNAKFTLLSPKSIEAPMDNHQLVSASYGSRNFQAVAWVKADETGMDMTLVNEIGASMGELSYREGAVSFSSPVFPGSVMGEYIIADFQLCFYNPVALREALEAAGLSMTETETGRRVLQGQTLIAEIEKGRSSVRFINHLRGYSYTLEGDF